MNALLRVLPAPMGNGDWFAFLYWEAHIGALFSPVGLIVLRLPELPFLSGNTGIPSGILPGVQRGIMVS